MTGEEAVAHVGDGSLDFVYLDARHDERSIAEDLAMWEPKLRSGGIMSGHDYLDGELPEGRFGVKTAVDGSLAGVVSRYMRPFSIARGRRGGW